MPGARQCHPGPINTAEVAANATQAAKRKKYYVFPDSVIESWISRPSFSPGLLYDLLHSGMSYIVTKSMKNIPSPPSDYATLFWLPEAVLRVCRGGYRWWYCVWTVWLNFNLPWRELTRRASSRTDRRTPKSTEHQRISVCIGIPIVMEFSETPCDFDRFSSL